MDGATYFGEWEIDKSHKFVPNGRGIVINQTLKFIYFGQIRWGMLHGKGIKVPFNRKGHLSFGYYKGDMRVKLLEEDQAKLTKSTKTVLSSGLKVMKEFAMSIHKMQLLQGKNN